jgi:hypothetical protein
MYDEDSVMVLGAKKDRLSSNSLTVAVCSLLKVNPLRPTV